MMAVASWLLTGSWVAGADKLELSPLEWQAVTVSKLLSYVQWPEAAATNAPGKLVLGILGKDPFGGMLEELLRDTRVNGLEVQVQIFQSPAPSMRCDVLFIPAEFNDAWKELSNAVDPFGKLIIGVDEDLVANNQVFNLRVKELKLGINFKNLKRAGLKVNSKLLRIAVPER